MNQPPPPNTAPSTHQPPAPVPTVTVAGWSNERKIAIGGAVAVVVGSLGSWATIGTAFGSISMSGMSGDGKITLVVAIVAAVLVVVRKDIAAVVLGAICGATMLNALVKVSSIGDSEFATSAPGWGLYVGVIGAIALCVGAFLARSKP